MNPAISRNSNGGEGPDEGQTFDSMELFKRGAPLPPILIPTSGARHDAAAEFLLHLREGGENIFPTLRAALETAHVDRSSLHECIVGIADIILHNSEERNGAWYALHSLAPSSTTLAAAALTKIEGHPLAASALRFLIDVDPPMAAACAHSALEREDPAIVFEALHALLRFDTALAQQALSKVERHLTDTPIMHLSSFIRGLPPSPPHDVATPPNEPQGLDEALALFQNQRAVLWPPANRELLVTSALRLLERPREE